MANKISKDIFERSTSTSQPETNEANIVTKHSNNETVNSETADTSVVFNEVSILVDAIKAGKLDTRANLRGINGLDKELLEGINDMLDAVIGPLNVSAGFIAKIASGDKMDLITDEYQGDFNIIKDNINKGVNVLYELLNETNRLTQASIAGQLDVRGNVSQFHGGWNQIVTGINDTLDAIIGPLNVSAEYVDRISKGDIPAKITDNYNGDFNQIKNNLNSCIDAVNGLVTDVNMLGQAAIREEFTTRADSSRHQGDFSRIVAGVNQTLDTVVEKIFWFESILDAVPFPVSVTDLNMQWTFLNTAVEKMANVTRKDGIGKQCSNWNAEICNTENCGIACLKKGKLQTDFEQSGHNFQVDSSYIHNARGEKTGHIEILQDTTAKKQVSEFQLREIDRVIQVLGSLAEGDLSFQLAVGDGNEYTHEVRENFILISNSLSAVRTSIIALVTDG